MKVSDELHAQMARLTDGQLLTLVGSDATLNRPEAIHLAHEELKRRGVDIPKGLKLNPWKLIAAGAVFVALVFAISSMRADRDTLFLALAPALWFFVWLHRAKFARWSYLSTYGKISEFRLFFAAIISTVFAVLLLLGKL